MQENVVPLKRPPQPQPQEGLKQSEGTPIDASELFGRAMQDATTRLGEMQKRFRKRPDRFDPDLVPLLQAIMVLIEVSTLLNQANLMAVMRGVQELAQTVALKQPKEGAGADGAKQDTERADRGEQDVHEVRADQAPA